MSDEHVFEYRAAREHFNVSATEVKRAMGTDILLRLDPEQVSDTKLVELVMIGMYRALAGSEEGK